MANNTVDIIYHNIYILDIPELIHKNISFLGYIKRNQELLKTMNVIVNITIVNQLNHFKITDFPILATKNKQYYGYHDVVIVYESNIREYNNYMASLSNKNERSNERSNDIYQVSKNTSSNNIKRYQHSNIISEDGNNPEKNNIDNSSYDSLNEDSDYQLHQYFQSNLRQVTNAMDDDDASPIGDIGNKSMMDQYHYMLDKRGKSHKNPYTPRKNNDIAMMTTNSGNKNETMQNMMFQQLQGINERNYIKNSNNDDINEEREDNINIDTNEESINIDPSKIEHDPDEDSQDNIMEQAYWNRISETK